MLPKKNEVKVIKGMVFLDFTKIFLLENPDCQEFWIPHYSVYSFNKTNEFLVRLEEILANIRKEKSEQRRKQSEDTFLKQLKNLNQKKIIKEEVNVYEKYKSLNDGKERNVTDLKSKNVKKIRKSIVKDDDEDEEIQDKQTINNSSHIDILKKNTKVTKEYGKKTLDKNSKFIDSLNSSINTEKNNRREDFLNTSGEKKAACKINKEQDELITSSGQYHNKSNVFGSYVNYYNKDEFIGNKEFERNNTNSIYKPQYLHHNANSKPKKSTTYDINIDSKSNQIFTDFGNESKFIGFKSLVDDSQKHKSINKNNEKAKNLENNTESGSVWSLINPNKTILKENDITIKNNSKTKIEVNESSTSQIRGNFHEKLLNYTNDESKFRRNSESTSLMDFEKTQNILEDDIEGSLEEKMENDFEMADEIKKENIKTSVYPYNSHDSKVFYEKNEQDNNYSNRLHESEYSFNNKIDHQNNDIQEGYNKNKEIIFCRRFEPKRPNFHKTNQERNGLLNENNEKTRSYNGGIKNGKFLRYFHISNNVKNIYDVVKKSKNPKQIINISIETVKNSYSILKPVNIITTKTLEVKNLLFDKFIEKKQIRLLLFNKRQNEDFCHLNIYRTDLVNKNKEIILFFNSLRKSPCNLVHIDNENSYILYIIDEFIESMGYNHKILIFEVKTDVLQKNYQSHALEYVKKAFKHNRNPWLKKNAFLGLHLENHILYEELSQFTDSYSNYSIISLYNNPMASDFDKYIVSMGMKKVKISDSLIEIIFLHVDFVQFIHKIPDLQYLKTRKVRFFIFDAVKFNIGKSSFLYEIFKPGGVLTFTLEVIMNITKDKNIFQIFNTLKGNNKNWILRIPKHIHDESNKILLSNENTPFFEGLKSIITFLATCIENNSAKTPLEYIQKLEYKYHVEKRFFFILTLKGNEGYLKKPTEIIDLIAGVS